MILLKIVVLDGFAANPGDLSWKPFSVFGEITVYDRTPAEFIVERIGDAEVVFTNKTPITERVFKSCPNLNYVGVLATGVNIVDLQSAAKYGVTVTNIPAYGTDAVAQHTFALLLECCNHISAYSQSVRKGDWIGSADWSYCVLPLTELRDKTLGIIGAGSIGSQVMQIAHAFQMNTLLCGRNLYQDDPSRNRVALNTLFSNSDIITLHCPLTETTSQMINQNSIQKMKKGVILVNTARGGLINEQDVADALNLGKISYYAADVLTVEPMKANSPLHNAKNCILTPHVAWAPLETRKRLLEIAFKNLDSFLKGIPVNTVS